MFSKIFIFYMLFIYVYKSFSTMLEEEHQMSECLAFCEWLDLLWLPSCALWCLLVQWSGSRFWMITVVGRRYGEYVYKLVNFLLNVPLALQKCLF